MPKPNTSIRKACRTARSRAGSGRAAAPALRGSCRRTAAAQLNQAVRARARPAAGGASRGDAVGRDAAAGQHCAPHRLFEIADERILERCRTARLDQPSRRVGRQHPARIHQRDPVAALGFIHEMGRDEDRHALIARQVDQQFPEIGRAPADRRPRSARRGSASRARARSRPRATAAGGCRAADAVGALVDMLGEAEAVDQFGDARLAPSAAAGGTAARADRGSAEPSARCRARTIATCSRRDCALLRSLASSGRPNSSASPSLAGSRPVSIFIVVVLPQPFEPRKPKISPRSIVKLT